MVREREREKRQLLAWAGKEADIKYSLGMRLIRGEGPETMREPRDGRALDIMNWTWRRNGFCLTARCTERVG